MVIEKLFFIKAKQKFSIFHVAGNASGGLFFFFSIIVVFSWLNNGGRVFSNGRMNFKLK